MDKQARLDTQSVITVKAKETEQDDTSSAINKIEAKNSTRIVEIIVPCIMGLVFGFAIQKGRVFEPKVIVDQMLLRDFTMMKMFLSAAATSLLVLTAFYIFSSHTRSKMQEVQKSAVESDRGLAITFLGAFFLGMGMAVAGACPGTVFVQMGSGIVWAFLVLLGGFLGAFVYGLLDNRIMNSFLARPRLPAERATVDSFVGGKFPLISIALLAMLVGCVVVFEYFFPYEPANGDKGWRVFEYESWPPIVAGVLVGSLQILGILGLTTTIGSSSFFTLVVSHIVWTVAPNHTNAYFRAFKGAIQPRWQLWYLVSAVIGAAISSLLSSSSTWTSPSHINGMGPILSPIGGFLLIFGSRMADGCTSGHGISGFSLLLISSIIAVASMFGAAIGTAFVLDALGAYPSYIE